MICNKPSNFGALMDLYRGWAKYYNKDTVETRNYSAPQTTANILGRALKTHGFGLSCRILDVGAGTGLAAQHLSADGYRNIDALDASKEMLEVAQSTNVYRECIWGVLGPGKKLPIETDSYDAIICVGVFTIAHVKAEGAMDEMVRVVRSGGLISFTIREDAMDDKEYGYEEKMSELCEQRAWRVMSVDKTSYIDFADCYVYVYQVL